MRKKNKSVMIGIAVAGIVASVSPAVLMPVSTFAYETGDTGAAGGAELRGASDTFRININNEFRYTEGKAEDYDNVGGVVSDKETASPGDTVTITKSGIGGLPEGRVKIIRTDSGQDVTDVLLGEHHSHFNGEESFVFTMPYYDITIEAVVIVGPYLGIAPIAYSDDPDYRLASAVRGDNGTVSVSSETLKKSDYDDSITLAHNKDVLTLTATPDEGYVFKKWQIRCGICNVAMTDDMDIKTTVDEKTGVATADLKYDGNIWIGAIFEKAGQTKPPTFTGQVNLHITYIDEEGNDITDKTGYSVLDSESKDIADPEDTALEDNIIEQTFIFSPSKKTVYDGDIADGNPIYRVFYEGSFESKTNIIRTDSLPEQYKPVSDVNLTTVIGDVNSKDGLGATTVVRSDNENVKIEKKMGEGLSLELDYDVIIPVELKKEGSDTDRNGEKETSGKEEKSDNRNTGDDQNTEVDQKDKETGNTQKGVVTSDQNRKMSSGNAAVSNAVGTGSPEVKATSAPATGDNGNMIVYVIAAGISAVSLSALVIKKAIKK